jgi:hypothetical protein
VVKTTGGEKVEKTVKYVETDYVNQLCISTTPVNCGKLLWKRLCTMWKTGSFQQVFGPCPNPPKAVDKSAYAFA